MRKIALQEFAPGLDSGRRYRVIVAIVALLGLAACTAREIPYADEIAAWRADKDRFMRESKESPVVEAERAAFPPLLYFPIESRVSRPGRVGGRESGRHPRDADLDGPAAEHAADRRARVHAEGAAAQADGICRGDRHELRRLFVPFHDLTNGSDTYPGGRYLDLERTPTGVYDLDFNRAYHPFCVFNATYDCPVPPRENRLGIPVRAGEQLGQTK